MIERDDLKEYIWQVVVDETIKYTTKEIEEDEIDVETRAVELFPTHLSKTEPYTDEHADRYGLMIISVFMHMNRKFELNHELDYPVRKEFELFPRISDVSRYIFNKIALDVLGRKGDDYEQEI